MKCVINEQRAEVIEKLSLKWEAILLALYLPLGYPASDVELTFNDLPQIYFEVRCFKMLSS